MTFRVLEAKSFHPPPKKGSAMGDPSKPLLAYWIFLCWPCGVGAKEPRGRQLKGQADASFCFVGDTCETRVETQPGGQRPPLAGQGIA